jgi:lysyl-tRNA synthetase class I
MPQPCLFQIRLMVRSEQLSYDEIKMKIISPTGVLSNAVHSVTDLMAAQIRLRECMGQKTRRAVFHVGTQINGVPHIGTFVTHASAFKLAQIMRRHFNGLSAEVEFVALDNASHDTKTGQNGAVYQRAYAQMDEDGFVDNQIRQNYSPFFADLQRVTGTPYRIIRYSEQQSTPAFRKVFLDSLGHIQELGHVLAPATASLASPLAQGKSASWQEAQ